MVTDIGDIVLNELRPQCIIDFLFVDFHAVPVEPFTDHGFCAVSDHMSQGLQRNYPQVLARENMI
ncbi:MAG: Uncharacterised protein [Hyphomonas sp. TMED17]|nr:MAG: Uncharacterised protein [Hyphomonas sp. TMED17]